MGTSAVGLIEELIHSVLIDFWPWSFVFICCLASAILYGFIYLLQFLYKSPFKSEKKQTDNSEVERSATDNEVKKPIGDEAERTVIAEEAKQSLKDEEVDEKRITRDNEVKKPTGDEAERTVIAEEAKQSLKDEEVAEKRLVTNNQVNKEPTATGNEAERSELKTKKSYFTFLIDRPFDANNDGNETTFNLINCLRHRLKIPSYFQTGNSSFDNSDLEIALPSSHNSSLTAGESGGTRVNSLYDTLLQLVDEFDATGIVEIFRLLLERRSAIPLFVPKSKKHYLNLLTHITLPGIETIRLGEDRSFMRVAVISCRQRNESQTCEILKSIFNIDSIHSLDLATSKISSEPMLAEIGCGCVVLTEASGSKIVHNVLVVHVIGDFRPLWSFLRRFTDYYLIEDSTVESDSFFSSFLTEAKKRQFDPEDVTKELNGCLWKPSCGRAKIERKTINDFLHFHMEAQLSSETLNKLKFNVANHIMKKVPAANIPRMLCEIPILEAEGYKSLECVPPATEIESKIAQSVQNLEHVKKNEFLLQKSFMQEAKHNEAKMENRLNEDKMREEDVKINEIHEMRRAYTSKFEKNSLLQLFLKFLKNEDPCSRLLSIRMMEKELAKRGEQELSPLIKDVQTLTASYSEKLSRNAVAEDLEFAKIKLQIAKTNLTESALNIEHLWRELSHLYMDMEPERRSPFITNIPRLAAQHLMDGFCLELLDGDSNMIRTEWLKAVLHQLGALMEGKRLFVLSVMGIQSSGKSTLLNTMFGIRMRTSVGQCTRGVNMQLVPVEGRNEYDYILLLDTEGTRSPEHYGLLGSEKRDNQMATLSILLSDATIIVIPGENDTAVKEILPIVLMAYQGSKLAEENGGRLSSRIFFVYNRIDTSQENKMNSIIQTLGTSLHEAFSKVQKSTGKSNNLKSDESPFANFKLNDTDSCGDVRILGNVKKQSKPPGDVPDEEYGEELIKFREHIHQRVTFIDGLQIWKSRSTVEFSSYIHKVWNCIISANFIFSFATVLEHMSFDKLDFEYKTIERKLAEAYQESFENVKKDMIKLIEEQMKSSCATSMRGPDGLIREKDGNSSDAFESFENQLRNELYPTEQKLDKEVNDVVNKKGREKWNRQFEEIWKNNKKTQAFNWRCNLKNAVDRLFNYENRVEKYKKKMRKEINEFFKSSNVSKCSENEKNKKFEEMFKNILDEAKKEFPPKDVWNEIKKVYQESIVIKNRQIKIKWADSAEKKFNTEFLGIFDRVMHFSKHDIKRSCLDSVYDTVKRILAGKLCYDDSIIFNVIRDVDTTIINHKITNNSIVQRMHQCGMNYIVKLMQDIQKEWEKENSVSAKFKSKPNKEILRRYFAMVSQGVEKTKLFAITMSDNLEKCIIPAFEKEMVQKTFQGIRKERWLYDARFMQKHMDLHLIDLLERNELDQVLDNIRYPKKFYEDVLHRLIAQKVPNAEDEWQSFKNHLSQAIEKAAAVEVDSGRAQTFVSLLRKEFFEGYLKSETLGSAFLIDCSGEYEDCDNEEKKEFQEACTQKLHEVLEKQPDIKNQGDYAKELSPKVVQYMVTLNDQAALPRCDKCCHMCKSLCLDVANHDTELKPHDAVHQPGGVAGCHYYKSNELAETTCCQSYELDKQFYLNKDYTKSYKYKDYSKVFMGWKDPRIFEELPVREYILATYNKQIAEKYELKPSKNIPPSYFRDLSTIKKQLEEEIAAY